MICCSILQQTFISYLLGLGWKRGKTSELIQVPSCPSKISDNALHQCNWLNHIFILTQSLYDSTSCPNKLGGGHISSHWQHLFSNQTHHSPLWLSAECVYPWWMPCMHLFQTSLAVCLHTDLFPRNSPSNSSPSQANTDSTAQVLRQLKYTEVFTVLKSQ